MINILNIDHFDIGGNTMLTAKIEHLLRFGNTADNLTRHRPTSKDQGNRIQKRIQRTEITNQHQRTA